MRDTRSFPVHLIMPFSALKVQLRCPQNLVESVTFLVYNTFSTVYTYLKKLCWVKRKNHKRYDIMGFWEDGTGNLETRFRLLVVNIFSLRRTFQSIVSQSVRPRNPLGRTVHSSCYVSSIGLKHDYVSCSKFTTKPRLH